MNHKTFELFTAQRLHNVFIDQSGKQLHANNGKNISDTKLQNKQTPKRTQDRFCRSQNDSKSRKRSQQSQHSNDPKDDNNFDRVLQ